jgi:UDP-GlcNAc:undecaprenyl-phosphate/decaprenyl-phosphate GlcNAc-1-phosphate transferase
MDLLLPLLVAMVVTMALIPLLMRAAGHLHVIDQPAGRKMHLQAIPRVGGIAMAIGVLLPLWLWLPMDATLFGYLLAVVVLLLFGVWDDRASLGPGVKLAGQALAVLVVMFVGHVSINSLMFDTRWTLPHGLSLALTFIFLIGVTNAINLSDGLDGLAGGTALLCCAALTLLAQNWGVRFVDTVGISPGRCSAFYGSTPIRPGSSWAMPGASSSGCRSVCSRFSLRSRARRRSVPRCRCSSSVCRC